MRLPIPHLHAQNLAQSRVILSDLTELTKDELLQSGSNEASELWHVIRNLHEGMKELQRHLEPVIEHSRPFGWVDKVGKQR